VNPVNIQTISGNDNSSFGQTLASDGANVYIGAPNWEKGRGTVYSCPINMNQTKFKNCENLFKSRKTGIGNSTEEKLGTSLLLTADKNDSEDDSPDLIACAPRYKVHLNCDDGGKNCKPVDIRDNNKQTNISYALPGRSVNVGPMGVDIDFNVSTPVHVRYTLYSDVSEKIIKV